MRPAGVQEEAEAGGGSPVCRDSSWRGENPRPIINNRWRRSLSLMVCLHMLSVSGCSGWTEPERRRPLRCWPETRWWPAARPSWRERGEVRGHVTRTNPLTWDQLRVVDLRLTSGLQVTYFLQIYCRIKTWCTNNVVLPLWLLLLLLLLLLFIIMITVIIIIYHYFNLLLLLLLLLLLNVIILWLIKLLLLLLLLFILILLWLSLLLLLFIIIDIII